MPPSSPALPSEHRGAERVPMNSNVGSATVGCLNTKYDIIPTAATLPSSLYPSQDQHRHSIASCKAKPAYVEPQMPLTQATERIKKKKKKKAT